MVGRSWPQCVGDSSFPRTSCPESRVRLDDSPTNPAGVEALQAVPELRRWQARVIGPSLFEALQEEQPAAG